MHLSFQEKPFICNNFNIRRLTRPQDKFWINNDKKYPYLSRCMDDALPC